MLLMDRPTTFAPRFDTTETFPADARAAMDLLVHGRFPPSDRRKLPRVTYHVASDMIFTGGTEANVAVYTRDANAWNVGFITRRPLVSGTKALVRLIAPDGRKIVVGCRVRRCQAFTDGWYEGFAEFSQPQYSLESAP